MTYILESPRKRGFKREKEESSNPLLGIIGERIASDFFMPLTGEETLQPPHSTHARHTGSSGAQECFARKLRHLQMIHIQYQHVRSGFTDSRFQTVFESH